MRHRVQIKGVAGFKKQYHFGLKCTAYSTVRHEDIMLSIILLSSAQKITNYAKRPLFPKLLV